MLSALIYAVRYINARWMRNDEGATAVEYGLLIAFIGLVVGVAALTLGSSITGLFNDTNAALGSAPTPVYATP